MFDDISYINLYSNSNEQLIAFYRDIIGIPPQDKKVKPEEAKWYGFDTRGVTFAIERESNRDKHPFTYNRNNPVLVQFRAKTMGELTAMNEHLKSKRIKLLTESEKKSYGVITNFLDPDGNLMEILYEPNL